MSNPPRLSEDAKSLHQPRAKGVGWRRYVTFQLAVLLLLVFSVSVSTASFWLAIQETRTLQVQQNLKVSQTNQEILRKLEDLTEFQVTEMGSHRAETES